MADPLLDAAAQVAPESVPRQTGFFEPSFSADVLSRYGRANRMRKVEADEQRLAQGEQSIRLNEQNIKKNEMLLRQDEQDFNDMQEFQRNRGQTLVELADLKNLTGNPEEFTKRRAEILATLPPSIIKNDDAVRDTLKTIDDMASQEFSLRKSEESARRQDERRVAAQQPMLRRTAALAGVTSEEELAPFKDDRGFLRPEAISVFVDLRQKRDEAKSMDDAKRKEVESVLTRSIGNNPDVAIAVSKGDMDSLASGYTKLVSRAGDYEKRALEQTDLTPEQAEAYALQEFIEDHAEETGVDPNSSKDAQLMMFLQAGNQGKLDPTTKAKLDTIRANIKTAYAIRAGMHLIDLRKGKSSGPEQPAAKTAPSEKKGTDIPPERKAATIRILQGVVSNPASSEKAKAEAQAALDKLTGAAP